MSNIVNKTLVKKLWDEGLSNKVIATRAGCSLSYPAQLARRKGWKPRGTERALDTCLIDKDVPSPQS